MVTSHVSHEHISKERKILSGIRQPHEFCINQARIIFWILCHVTGSSHGSIRCISDLKIEINSPAANDVSWIKSTRKPDLICTAGNGTISDDAVIYLKSLIFGLRPSDLELGCTRGDGKHRVRVSETTGIG